MALVSGGACPFLDKAPTEIRLEIYEWFLQFDAPIMKVTRMEEDPSTAVGILFANKQTLHEALEVLYKINTIFTTHRTFCGPSTRNLRLPDFTLVNKLYISTGLENHGSWTQCASCASVTKLLKFFSRDLLPKLRSVVITFNRYTRRIHDAARHRKRNNPVIEFTDVGRFRPTNLPDDIDIQFVHEELTAAWKFFNKAAASDILNGSLGESYAQEHGGFDSLESMRLDFCYYYERYGEAADPPSTQPKLFRNLLYLSDVSSGQTSGEDYRALTERHLL